jgi:phosphatidylserine decarboxylase
MSTNQIKYIERYTNVEKIEQVPSGGFMEYLYSGKPFGKLLLHQVFKRKWISAFVGRFMSSSLSKSRINKFIKTFNMSMDDYMVPKDGFKSFNDFFYRKLKPNTRIIEEGVVSPADGKILAFNSINDVDEFFVKGESFSLHSFFRDEEIAKKYSEGAMAIIRLAPVDYHRYHFHVSGSVGANIKIKGAYFSVSPLALQKSLRIFCENKREYVEINNPEIGDSLICDVGATMTGSIIQTFKENTKVNKGDEKGYFAFGGSTLVLFFQKNTISFSKDLIQNTKNGFETTIRMGQRITKK